LGAERTANRNGSDEKKDSYHRRIISQINEAEAKGFIQQRLLLTVYFVFGQRDRVFRRLIGAALTFKLSADSL